MMAFNRTNFYRLCSRIASPSRMYSIEVLEERRMLSISADPETAPLDSGIFDERLDLAMLTAEARTFIDQGDYYWLIDQRVPLLRVAGEYVVHFAPDADAESALSKLTSHGELAGYRVSRRIDANTAIVSAAGEALTRASSRDAASIAKPNGILSIAPSLVTANERFAAIPTGVIEVELRPGVDAKAFFAEGFTGYQAIFVNMYIGTLAGGDMLGTIARANALQKDPRVVWASPEFHSDIRLATNDTLYASQWTMENTGQNQARTGADAHLKDAWTAGATGNSNLVIAVVDDGVQLNHPDLNIFTNTAEIAGNSIDDDANGFVDDVHGWDFRGESLNVNALIPDNNPGPSTADDNHGTAVAGVAAAIGGNTAGVTGAIQAARILPIKIARDGVFLSLAQIAPAIYYAAGAIFDPISNQVTGTWRGADVINCSWGVDGASDAMLTKAFLWATTHGRNELGVPVFVATGNSASGYEHKVTPNLPPGDWVVEWKYTQTGSTAFGRNLLANVTLADGTHERFDVSTLPTGWSTSGPATWSVSGDRTTAYGTGRYKAISGFVNPGQTSIIRSNSTTATGTWHLDFYTWFVNPSMGNLQVSVYLNGSSTAYATYSYGSTYSGILTTPIKYPANLASTIAVGASTDWDYRADYSQYGSQLDFVAPSGGGFAKVTTTDRTGANGYNTSATDAGYDSTFSGTSSAAPLAAGIGMLLLANNPDLTANQIRQAMQMGADKIAGETAFSDYYGHGRVNARNTLDYIDSIAGDTITSISTAPTSVNLVAGSDTGISSTDNQTNRNNSSAGSVLQFLVSGVTSGATVKIYADGQEIGSGTAAGSTITITTTSSADNTLANGERHITARQRVTGLIESYNSSVLNVTIDAGVPVPNITPVSHIADQRANPPSSLKVTFSEAVYGFDITDLILKRGGGSNLLTPSQTLSTSDNITWTIGNLSLLTATEGQYSMYLPGSGTGITDSAGNAAYGDALTWSPWHNINGGLDVSNNTLVDPNDVLVTVNVLNASGTTPLPIPWVSGISPGYIDVNNDLIASAIDVLIDVNFLNVNGTGPVPLSAGDYDVRVRTEPTDAAGNPLTEINEGDTFYLRVYVQDLRSSGSGVFSAYVDVAYDSDLAASDGALMFTDYTNGKHSALSAGLIDEAGAFGGTYRLNTNERMLFKAPMKAKAEGTVYFVPDAAETYIDTLVYDSNDYVTPSRIQFLTSELLVHPAAKITEVKISGSTSGNAAYVVPVGSGEQLRTIPVGAADTIAIKFNQAMSVGASGLGEDDLTIVGHGDFSSSVAIVAGSFNWNSSTHVATWKIDTDANSATRPVITGQFEIILSDAIEGLFDNQLDGEWVNPTSLSDSDSAISEFPSGDGEAGGEFSFYFTLLPGDIDLNNIVDYTDLGILLNHYPTNSGATWAIGDTDGNGIINFNDLGTVLNNYEFDFTIWPEGEMMRFAGDGGNQPRNLTTAELESLGKQILKAYKKGSLTADLVDEIMASV